MRQQNKAGKFINEIMKFIVGKLPTGRIGQMIGGICCCMSAKKGMLLFSC